MSALSQSIQDSLPPSWFGQILAAQRQNRTCLPFHLGLNEADFKQLLNLNGLETETGQPNERDQLRQDLLALREDEWQQLRTLLLSYCEGRQPDEEGMAAIVAAACLGGDHLWRDLGLDSRQQLRELLFNYFPGLAALNANNMRWKKFFYKQLCEQEGGYVCRSPSCEQCPSYQECFGDER